jgi:hypothetical protein
MAGPTAKIGLTIPSSLLFLLLLLDAQPAVRQSSNGTLYFVGSTNTSVVVAADSLVTRIGEPSTTNDKLMPFGNVGVCFIGNRSVFGSTGDADRLDLNEAVRDWINEHPKANLPEAYESMAARLLNLMNQHRRKHPTWYTGLSKNFSYFICVSYYMAFPKIYGTPYNATPAEITNQPNNYPIPPGRFKTWGWDDVCKEITEGKPSKEFSELKSDPVIAKYRKAKASNAFSTITENDLLTISRICLDATESPEGSKFDSHAKEVGPPNRYAVIDRKGFRSVSPP